MALELAHRCRYELLLWDTWPGLDAFDADVVDRVAELLVAADAGAESADDELAALYRRYGPGDVVTQLSPYGDAPQLIIVDPDRRADTG